MRPVVSEWIFDVTDATFYTRVIEQSKTVPVLVDFWAQWCGPCRILTPVLENMVSAREGKILLARANADQCPQTTRFYGVQGIPTVKLFKDGKVIGEFAGVLPEVDVGRFLDAHIPTDADTRAVQAESLFQEGSYGKAGSMAREILESNPGHELAVSVLVKSLLVAGKMTEAIRELEHHDQVSYGLDFLRGAMEFWNMAARGDSAEQIPGGDELDALLLAAARAFSAGDHEKTMEILLQSVVKNRKYRGELARKAMVALFCVVPDRPLVDRFRTDLSRALY